MEPLLLGFLAIGAMLTLALLGVPIAVALGLSGLGGLFLVGGERLLLTTLETLPYRATAQYSYVTIPMFILMGVIASTARVTDDLYEAFHRLFAKVRGSLYMVTTLSSAGFAAISGSTIVNAAVFTRLALPQMIRYGYDRGLGAGCIAAAGTFAALIPPSIMMVIYSLLTGESTGRLLIAGVVPGLLTAFAYIVGIAILVRLRPGVAPPVPADYTLSQKLESLSRIGPFLILAVIVIGGIYTGIMFPSSAGAVGAVGAFLIAVFRRAMTPGRLMENLKDTARTTAVLFIVLIAGLIFSRFLVFSGFIDEVAWFVEDAGISPTVVLLLLVVMYIVLGMFIDTVSMVVVTVPFVHPLMMSLGYDPIWLGVVIIKLAEISVITPPVGLNLFAVLAAARGDVQSRQLFRGVLPFLAVEMVVLAILISVPAISLWLPNRML